MDGYQVLQMAILLGLLAGFVGWHIGFRDSNKIYAENSNLAHKLGFFQGYMTAIEDHRDSEFTNDPEARYSEFLKADRAALGLPESTWSDQ